MCHKGSVHCRKRTRSSYEYWPRSGSRRKTSQRNRLLVQELYKQLGELSQPLTVIIGTSALLASHLAPADPLNQDLNLIINQTARINMIIKHIHELIYP